MKKKIIALAIILVITTPITCLAYDDKIDLEIMLDDILGEITNLTDAIDYNTELLENVISEQKEKIEEQKTEIDSLKEELELSQLENQYTLADYDDLNSLLSKCYLNKNYNYNIDGKIINYGSKKKWSYFILCDKICKLGYEVVGYSLGDSYIQLYLEDNESVIIYKR